MVYWIDAGKRTRPPGFGKQATALPVIILGVVSMGQHFTRPEAEEWMPDFLNSSPIFEPLRAAGAAMQCSDWPTLAEFRELLRLRQPPIRTRSGVTLQFVRQAARSSVFEHKYEIRAYAMGEVQVRTRNWHDLFNVLTWLTFPQSKAALNERHYLALTDQRSTGAANRGPVQDAMTLFDEGGVFVAASDPGLLNHIRRFEWRELFCHNRARISSELQFYLFGHALYEKALRPFAGITARGMLFEVDSDFFRSALAAQLASLDAMAAERLCDAALFHSTRELAPIPILGVPAWCPDNECETYYGNAEYFRPGREDQA